MASSRPESHSPSGVPRWLKSAAHPSHAFLATGGKSIEKPIPARRRFLTEDAGSCRIRPANLASRRHLGDDLVGDPSDDPVRVGGRQDEHDMRRPGLDKALQVADGRGEVIGAHPVLN